MECYAAPDKLFVCCWADHRCCKDGYNLVDPERRGETCGYEDKTRKGIKT